MEIEKLIEQELSKLGLKEKVDRINELRLVIHNLSPFKNEPVDYVKWVLNDTVVANDYNPNKVAPPEMELLEVSILNDGYTQPIVSWSNPEKDGKIEVIDGFHRNRVGKESVVVKNRVQGYLPVVDIRKEQSNKNDRIASTIRHNRARGKHQVNAMSEIVIELKNRNWSNNKIAKQLGMDEEEVLRLCQISGLEHLFSDRDFSRAWVSDDSNETFIPAHDKLLPLEIEIHRAGNTNDPDRIFHTYDKWECQKAGFYLSKNENYSNEEAESQFISLLSDVDRFEKALNRVITEWKFSCEHYLTNRAMNRIAWLGQASVCIETGVPSSYSGAWFKIPKETQSEANLKALEFLNKWLVNNKRKEVSLKEALSEGRQVELY
jgi:ParB-like chromosome segregation protein Spo0J